MRATFYVLTALVAVFAAVMVFGGHSAEQLLSSIWVYLGPGFVGAFVLLTGWGLWSLTQLRRGYTELGLAHLDLAIEGAREAALQGTILGILTSAGALTQADLSDRQQVLALIPNVLGGVSLGLATTAAFRLLAYVLRAIGGLSTLPVAQTPNAGRRRRKSDGLSKTPSRKTKRRLLRRITHHDKESVK